MTHANPDERQDHLNDFVHFLIGERQLGQFTAMPGEIVRYDAATRRAVVRGAIDQAWTPKGGERQFRPRPLVRNVPVLHPYGGGYRLHFPLLPGDPVLLVYSCRSLKDWKKTHRRGPTTPSGVMLEMDAIAIPGFGPAVPDPPAASGMVLQTADGEVYLSISGGGITLSLPAEEGRDEKHRTTVTVSSGTIELSTPPGEDDEDDERPTITISDGDIKICAPKGSITLESENQSQTLN